ncbi:MAG: asparagine synthase-related protein [Pseudohongiellaceae bacterium]
MSSQATRLHRECSEASGARRFSECLVARLRLTADPSEKLLLSPIEAAVRSAEENTPFIIAQNATRRKDGLAAAIIGEPGIVTDRLTNNVSRIDADALLDLYATEGKDCLGKLQGSWGVVIVDPRQGRIVLATDRMGRQPVYYRIDGKTVLIGSSLGSLRQFSGDAGLDAQALYHYLYFHMVPSPDAIVTGFHKLESAHVLEVTPEGHELSRYWTPVFSERNTGPMTAAHEELRVRLRAAVQRCTLPGASGGSKVGAFLSGGLDSSTVAGMLSEVQGGGDAYCIGFDAEGYDEVPYARLAARHFGIQLHEHYVTPDEVVQALPKIAATFDEPFGNSSVLPAYFCARMAAEDGIDVLLAGDGGDELFAGNERYARQRIFENYRRAPGWVRAGIIEPLLKSLPARLSLVSKGRSYIRQANTPLPERLQYYGFLEQNSPHDVFCREFLEWVDTDRPLKLLDDIYHCPGEASALNRMLFLDWQITLADNDLLKVNQACALAGVAVRYPMLDDDLVEFSNRVPSAWKLPGNGAGGRKLRHFYRQGLTGWLPDKTINKSKHGFGLPFGVWMKTHKPLQELAYDNILRLKARGLFLPDFLDQAIDSHRNAHAAYFGELIWVLTCLELWLTANEPGFHVEQKT